MRHDARRVLHSYDVHKGVAVGTKRNIVQAWLVSDRRLSFPDFDEYLQVCSQVRALRDFLTHERGYLTRALQNMATRGLLPQLSSAIMVCVIVCGSS